MKDTIMFDLDGTLLKFSLDMFISAYFKELKKVFTRLGMDAELSMQAVMAGTNAMMLNNGEKTNCECFWKTFADCMGLTSDKLKIIEDTCDRFYSNEFNAVKSIMETDSTGMSKRLVRSLSANGYTIVLATNPLFPACAVTTRLLWAGLLPEDFLHITHYANSTYSKPNPGYYEEILKTIKKKPEQCIMVGNSVNEDMSAGALGIETFLVTDYLENETGADIAAFRHGSLVEAEQYLIELFGNFSF